LLKFLIQLEIKISNLLYTTYQQ